MQGSHKLISSPATIEPLEARRLLSAAPATTWGVYDKMLGLDQLTANYPKLTGSGETIAIIDSGVDYKHPSLGGGWGNKVIAGYDFENNTSDPFCYTNAHGTAVVGVAAATPYYVDGVRYQGIAPGTDIVALEEDNASQIKSSLDWVIAHKTQYNIVSANITDWTGPSSAYASEINTLTKMGVFISCPAGNGGAGTQVVANTQGNDFAIGGVSQNGYLWSGSSRGRNTPLVAPADDVMFPYYQTNNGAQVYYAGGSGTSWAAPAAAGAAALLKEINPNWSPTQILSILQQSADKVYDGASNWTYDRINVDHAVELAYSMVGHGSTPAPTPAPAPAPIVSKPKTTPAPAPAPVKTVTTTPHLRGHHHRGHHHDAVAAKHAPAPIVTKPKVTPKPAPVTPVTTTHLRGHFHKGHHHAGHQHAVVAAAPAFSKSAIVFSTSLIDDLTPLA